jgi:OOP family OmpA-OmpF porin
MKKVLVASLLSSLVAGPAYAAVPSGFVSADLQSWSATNADPYGNPGIGFRIGGGYRFTPNVGLEVNYGQSGKSSDVGGTSYKISATQLAVVGTYPVNTEFDVFGKLGMSANKVTVSGGTCTNCSKTDVLIGVGGQYNINRQLGVRLQYESLGKVTNTGSNDTSATTLSAGVVYAF